MEEKNIERTLDDASRWARLGAAIIDSLIMSIVTVPLAYSIGFFDDLMNSGPDVGKIIIIAVVGIGFYFAVNGKLLYDNAQTIGKKVNGIKVVNLDGTTPNIQDLIIKRYIPYFGFPYIPFIGSLVNLVNICFIFGEERRCLHDKIAGTRVAKEADTARHF